MEVEIVEILCNNFWSLDPRLSNLSSYILYNLEGPDSHIVTIGQPIGGFVGV